MSPANGKWFIVTSPLLVDNAAYTTNEIDTLGWEYLEIVAVVGVTDIAMAALTVTESDTTGSGHANVTGLIFGTSADIDGTTSVLPAADDDNQIFACEIDLKARKRFIDVTATAGDGTAGTNLCILARLTRGKEHPRTSTQKGCTHILRV